MTKTDYPIYAEDGTLFCKKVVDEYGEEILEGPKGKRITFRNLSVQVFNPTNSCGLFQRKQKSQNSKMRCSWNMLIR